MSRETTDPYFWHSSFMSSRISGNDNPTFLLNWGKRWNNKASRNQWRIEATQKYEKNKVKIMLLYLHIHPHCAGGCHRLGWADAEQEKAAEPGRQCEVLLHTHAHAHTPKYNTPESCVYLSECLKYWHLPKGILKNGLSRAVSAEHLCFGSVTSMLQTQSNMSQQPEPSW